MKLIELKRRINLLFCPYTKEFTKMNNMDDKVHNCIMNSQYRTRIYIFGIKISDKIEKLDQTFEDVKTKDKIGF